MERIKWRLKSNECSPEPLLGAPKVCMVLVLSPAQGSSDEGLLLSFARCTWTRVDGVLHVHSLTLPSAIAGQGVPLTYGETEPLSNLPEHP